MDIVGSETTHSIDDEYDVRVNRLDGGGNKWDIVDQSTGGFAMYETDMGDGWVLLDDLSYVLVVYHLVVVVLLVDIFEPSILCHLHLSLSISPIRYYQ